MAKTKLKTLKLNPDNPRTTTDEKIKLLQGSMKEFGDLGGFIFNRKTKQFVGGHQRTKAASSEAEVTIEREYKKPTRTGTVAEGYVLIEGERFAYREVEWSPLKEKAANIAANKGAGEWDYAVLGEWIQELHGKNFNLDLTMFDENERKGFFSDMWEDEDKDAKVEKEEAHVEGFRDTIKIKVPKAVKSQVVELLTKAITGSKFCDVVEITE